MLVRATFLLKFLLPDNFEFLAVWLQLPSPLVFFIKFGFLEKCKIPSGYKIASGRDHIKLCCRKSCVCVYKIRMFSLLEIARVVLVFHSLLVHSSE